jgi:hypothetical protein
MKARFRKSPAASEGFEIRETSRSSAFCRTFGCSHPRLTPLFPSVKKMNRKIGSAPWAPRDLTSKIQAAKIQAAVHKPRKTS